MNRLGMASVTATEHELTRVDAEIKKGIQSIKDGVPGNLAAMLEAAEALKVGKPLPFGMKRLAG